MRAKKIAARKELLAEKLVEMARDVLCMVTAGEYDWSKRVEKSLAVCALVSATDEQDAWELARAFGYFPTVLYVHRISSCRKRTVTSYLNEPVDPTAFNCPKCINEDVALRVHFFTDSPKKP